ncbi:MAG TPA: COG1361 S-layer family protein [Methanosarcina sp.]|nr:COG1361 S-layer family protein [Methanosarcina sp.]
MILFSLLLCSGTSLAESTINTSSLDKGLSVDLLNQDPDPVNPGDVLEVRISIENTGYDDIENCFVEIKPEYPFKALSGEKLVESIGTLGKRSEDDRRKVLKFKVGVENDINEGSYPLKVYLYSTDKKKKVSLTKELTIDIDSESNAEIEYISVEKLIPGEKTKLTFGIRNAGNSPLKNSMFSWESTNDVILPVGSSNVKHINLIDVGETANVSFEVLTNVNTKPGLYKLDMTLTYDDIEELQTITEAGYVENEKRKTIESKAGIYIGGTTDFDIAFMEQSPTGAYTFSVSNIGNNGANSVKVSVPLQENWTVTDGSNSVVLGNLAKGDYTIADFNLEPVTVGEELPIKFEISYTSSDGIRQVEENVISLYASPSTLQAGSKMTEESSKSSMLSHKLLFLLLLGAAGFFVYKKHQKKVIEKNAEANLTGENQTDEKKMDE